MSEHSKRVNKIWTCFPEKKHDVKYHVNLYTEPIYFVDITCIWIFWELHHQNYVLFNSDRVASCSSQWNISQKHFMVMRSKIIRVIYVHKNKQDKIACNGGGGGVQYSENLSMDYHWTMWDLQCFFKFQFWVCKNVKKGVAHITEPW